MSCPYKNLFGVPGTGFHSYRFAGIAVGDTVGTILLAWLTSYLTQTGFWWNLLVWFIAGEFLHYYFGTQTAFLKSIGIEPKC
jgi:hypothetical protein